MNARPEQPVMYRFPIVANSAATTLYRLLVSVCLLSVVTGLHAATVYKTVDDNGVVSYSDTPPAEDIATETLVIDVQDPQLTETEQQRMEDMRATTDRMVADREAREKHRAELREQQARNQAERQRAASPDYLVIESDTYPVYYPYPVRRPGWNRPRPSHPIARPPLRPPGYGRPPVAVPHSPGHDYPASLIRKGYSPEVRAAFER
jgi:hypothetical protein